jgi:hypothetical protein
LCSHFTLTCSGVDFTYITALWLFYIITIVSELYVICQIVGLCFRSCPHSLVSATLFLVAISDLSTVLGNFHSDRFWFCQAETFLLYFVIFILFFKAQSLQYKYFFCCRLLCVDCSFAIMWTATSVTQRWTLYIHQNWFLSFLYLFRAQKPSKKLALYYKVCFDWVFPT